MAKPVAVSILECPLGEVLHKYHTWRQGFFLVKYSCCGWSQDDIDMMVVLKAGSAGTLTAEQAQAWRDKRKARYYG